MQLSDGLQLWDVSAGQSHSLLLADGDCVQPVLLYCGQQQEPRSAQSERPSKSQRSPNRAESYTVRPTMLPFCSEVCMKHWAWFCLAGLTKKGEMRNQQFTGSADLFLFYIWPHNTIYHDIEVMIRYLNNISKSHLSNYLSVSWFNVSSTQKVEFVLNLFIKY